MGKKGEITINTRNTRQQNQPQKEEKKNEDSKQLESLVDLSERELFKMSTVFPFDLFPDKVSIDLSKISIVYGNFLESETVQILPLQDVVDVIIETAPFFATLYIVDSNDPENPVKIGYLKKGEALKASRIIRGLLIAKKQNMDLLKLKGVPSLTEKLEKLGRTSG